MTTITGTDSNDTLRGTSGNDLLYGLAGNDTINALAGADEMRGGEGNDSLYADSADTVVDGGTGFDTVYAQGTQGITLDLGAGSVERVYGGSGSDVLNAGSALTAVQVYGGVGNDTVTGSAFNDTLRGDAGSDRIDGGAGNDSIVGGEGADQLYGGAGDDTLYADAADTVINGGAGFDTVYIQDTLGVSLDLGASGIERVYGGSGGDALDAGSASQRVLLYGGGGDDTVTGSSFNDDLRGEAGDDVIQGGAGNDLVSGGAGADRLYGGAGNDSLYVDAADTVVDGGDGFDTVSIQDTLGVVLDLGASSVEQVYGGAGGDTLNAASATERAVIVGGAGDDAITGSAFNDSLRGDDGDDLIQGGDGNDTITGSAGADRLYGGAGDDTIYADGADTVIDGGAGIDSVTIQGTLGVGLDLAAAGIERAYGGAGDDMLDGAGLTAATTLYGGAGDDTLTGSAFNDSLRGDAGHDVIQGGAGNDSIQGGEGADELHGGAGDDTLTVDAADTVIDGGAGTDSVYIQDTLGVRLDLAASAVERAFGGTGSDDLDGGALSAATTIYGGAGNDTITGSGFNDDLRGDAGDDTIRGGAGNDSIQGGAGADSLSGEAGNDTFYIDATDTVSGGDGTDTVNVIDPAGIAFDLAAASVERAVGGTGADSLTGATSAAAVLIYGGAGNDTINGSAFNDDLRGDAGDDTIRGGAGNDVIYGGTGVDTLSGEAGNDTFYIDGADSVSGGDGTDSVYIQDATGVTLDLGAATVERAFGGTGNDTLSGASSAVGVTIYGGAGNDTITGSGFNDDLRGDAGDDAIRGGAGNDVIYGGTGADTLYGFGGNDTFYIDGTDTVSGGDGTDSVYIQDAAGIAFDLGATAVERAFGGTGNDTLSGASSAVGVTIYGGTGNDRIIGSAFNDDLRGDAGDDVLEGGAGRDALYGGAGIDTARYDGSASAVTISLTTAKGTGGQAEGDTFNSIENLVGSAFADRLEGDAYANRLTGGGGADTLLGGAGDDVLEVADTRFTRIDGGTGEDTLRFGGQTLTLAEEAVTNIERIDLTPGAGQLVVLDRASVLAATDGRHLLRVTGGSDGTVLFRESEWVLERTETVGGQDYRVYRNGDAAVAVQTAVRQSPNKLLIGTTRDDDFTFDPGDGHVVMFTHGGDDTLRLSDGLRTIDAHLERVGNDLIVWWDGAPDRLTVINHFAPDGGSGEGALSHLVFADGEGTWDVRAEQLILGGPSNDTLTLGANQITATTIFGGGGLDEVVIGPGITIDRVQLIRVGNDLRVTVDNSTVLATIINHFGATGPGSGTGGIERLRFTDGGEVWTISGDHVILGTPADDAWTLGRGCGKFTVFREPTGSSDIRLGADVTADQVSMVRIGLDLHLKIDNSTDEVVLVNHFAGNAEQGGVHTVSFDAGTRWNITGKLVMVGGPGDDHFQIDRGVGSRTVYAGGGGGDRIDLGPRISVSDVKLIRVGNDLKISIDNSSDQITVINHFADTGGAGPATVRELSFADGTSWTIHGDTIWMGGEGNDIVTLQTGCGPHTVYFGGGWDHIAIGDTVRASDLRMVRLGDDLEISIDNSADKLTVLNHFGAGYGSSPARTLSFSDGTTWNVKGENILIGGPGDDSFGVDESDRDVLIYRGGTGSDSLTVGPNIRHADVQLIRVGNDLEMRTGNGIRIATVVNQFAEGVTGTGSLTEITFLDDGTTWNVKGDKILIGGPGDDTFVVRKNVGHYTVYPGSGTNDITIGDDVAASDVRLVRVGDDLKLSIDGSDTEVTFLNHFADGAGSGVLRNVTHNDGTVWNIEGENILIGGPGNDGFTVDKGTGSVTVYPGKGSDEIRFGASVSAAEVSLIRVGNDLRMDIANTADSVLLVNHFAGSAGGPGNVTKLTYHDGSSWNIEGANILVGGEGNDRFHVDKGMGQRVAYVGPGSNHIDIADQVSRSDVLVSRVGNDLVISLDNSSDELTVLNHFTSAPVRDLVFNDLTTWNVVGENILIGGPGDDSFVVNKGLDGVLNATVIFSGGGDHNRIRLGDTIDTSNVQMTRVGDDLRVRIDNSTEDLLVVNHFAASGGSSVEDIEFVGGTTWNIKGENILIGGVGDDAFQLDKGNGPQFFYASGGDNHVVIGPGISASSLRISRVGNDLKMKVDNSTDEMTVVNHFLFGGGIRDVTFNNGTVWNVWGENILIGGPGNDGFTVTKGSGPRTLFAGTTDGSGEIRVGEGISQSEIRVERVGDDMVVRIDNSDYRLTIVNHFAGAPVRQLVFGDRQYLSLSGENLMIGGGGHDRFVVNPGTPEQKIYVSGGDSVEFGPDTIITDIRIVRVGDDIRIYTDNTQNFITIVNWQGGLEALNFPTGQRTLSMSGENLMIGGPGNNTFRVNRSGGGSGEAGGEVIYIYAGGDDNTVELGDSITTSDVQLSRVGNDLEMTIDNSSKKVRIFNHFSPTPAGSAVGTAAQKIVFDNGTVWNVVGENILIGGPGNDNFTVNKGQGRLIVYPGGGGGTKRVVLGREIHVSDVRVERVGNDLRVYTADGTVDTVIVNHFGGGATGSACGCGGLDELTFDTGTTWNVAGENILIGGEGDDSFTVNETVPGSGPTYIHVGGGHHNVVRLGPTAVPGNLRLFRVGNDLHVQSADGTTDAVIVNHFGGGIEQVFFAGGTTWNVVGENILIGGGGDDTFTVNEASGDQIIYMSGGSDTVRLTGGTTRIENVIIDRVGNDLEIRFNNSTRKIKVVNNFAGCAGDGVGAISFDDGSTLSLTGDRTLAGTAGNDVLTGGSGNDTVDTLAGNDILTGGKGTDTLKGGSGDDVYRFAAGDGKDTIVESAGTDEIQFGAGLAASSLVMRISGDDLVLSFTGTADEVRISHHFAATGYKVERARFGDGTIVPLALDADLVLTYTGTDAAETITGRASRDLITGGKGNDSLNGGSGNDTYYINAGDGQDTITETGGTDTIVFGAGLSSTGFQFVRIDATDLYIQFAATNEPNTHWVRIVNHFVSTASRVDVARFADGTEIDLSGDAIRLVTVGGDGRGNAAAGHNYYWENHPDERLIGGEAGDDLRGNYGNDTIYGYGGDDYIDGGADNDTLFGYAGNDTVLGGAGFDYIDGGDGDDSLTGGDAGDLVSDWIYGQAGNDRLDGGGGNDGLWGGDGNDTLIGGTGNDILEGGAGENVYRIGLGDGQDSITASGSRDVIEFGASLSSTGFQFVRIDATDLYIKFTATNQPDAQYVRIVNHFVSTASRVDVARFADGTEIDLSGDAIRLVTVGGDGRGNAAAGHNYYWENHPDERLIGGEAGDDLRGNYGNDTIYGYGGDDYIDGGADNDTLFGYAGNDTVLGGAGFDYIDGGDGDDSLTGGDAGDLVSDWIYGQAGNDRLDGGGGNDGLWGGDGNDVLIGGIGNDTLDGGAGNDTYFVHAGDGIDTITNNDSASTSDQMVFDAGIRNDQVWFERSANDLRVTVIGTSGQITVQGWYNGNASQLDAFKMSDGKVLLAAQVEQLRSAMAAFNAPGASQADLTQQQHAMLDPVIAAAWH